MIDLLILSKNVGKIKKINMRYIITEDQEIKLKENDDIATKAKMVSKIFNAIYPDYIIDYDELVDHTNVIINDENGEEKELMMF